MRALCVIGCALLTGCGAKDADIAYTREHVPYSRSAYEDGRAQAEADIRAGRLVLEDYGFPRKGQQEYADILRDRYHVELRRVASDIVDPKTYGHAFGYNAVSEPEIKRRFGSNVLEKERQKQPSIMTRSSRKRPNQTLQPTHANRETWPAPSRLVYSPSHD